MLAYYFAKLIKKMRSSAIKNSFIHKTSKVESGSNIINVQMGRYSFCGYDCEIVNCEIGSFCSIANNVSIGGAMHPMHWVSMSPVFYKGRDSVKEKFSEHEREVNKKTVIGHDVWIGKNALIKQGVNIGTGAVIGMGSVVTKDVVPYSIVAGNPAREIRKRFDDKTISRLLVTEWWEYSSEKLRAVADKFTQPEEFLDIIERG